VADKEGAEKYTTEIVADRMQMLGSRAEAITGAGAGAQAAERAPATAGAAAGAKSGGKFDDFEDDIPF
jgi:single-strand DNA-binding protein